MGLLFAPLSTLIMATVPGERVAGAAAINAVLSRFASVLGIALLGPLALFAFERALGAQSAHQQLESEAREFLLAQAPRLAEVKPAQHWPDEHKRSAQVAIRSAYVGSFRVVAIVCAAIVATAAALALLLIRAEAPDSRQTTLHGTLPVTANEHVEQVPTTLTRR